MAPENTQQPADRSGNSHTTLDFLIWGNPKWEGEGPAIPIKNVMFFAGASIPSHGQENKEEKDQAFPISDDLMIW